MVRVQSAVLLPATFPVAVGFLQICSFPFGLHLLRGFHCKASVAAGGVSRRRPVAGKFSDFRSPESRWSFKVCFFQLAATHSMRLGCKRFVAIESKSFDLAIVGTAEDVLKISENGRGRRISLLLPENVALWLLRAWESKRNRTRKFLQLSSVNKGKRTFNERGWAKIFDALTEIVNLAFLGASGALRRPLQQVTLHVVLCLQLQLHLCLLLPLRVVVQSVVLLVTRMFPSFGPTRCCNYAYENVNEAVEKLSLSKHMQVDRGKQSVVTELGMRASSSSVSTQVYS
ncbi:hypothetical protein Cgig2_026690 [Carnegiea gigantea]|uniref:Uncharacterized protein n=1 Tax=Carnegiea gigantea TaxID=171969 RepID=A0A9Q1GLE2_9CARY|nr:hypothetical protein Cgig2_026690 [Carnegiea gigantea]